MQKKGGHNLRWQHALFHVLYSRSMVSCEARPPRSIQLRHSGICRAWSYYCALLFWSRVWYYTFGEHATPFEWRHIPRGIAVIQQTSKESLLSADSQFGPVHPVAARLTDGFRSNPSLACRAFDAGFQTLGYRTGGDTFSPELEGECLLTHSATILTILSVCKTLLTCGSRVFSSSLLYLPSSWKGNVRLSSAIPRCPAQ